MTHTFLTISKAFKKNLSCGDVLPHMRILAHTRMGRPICVYSYGTPIRVWDNILSHMSIYLHVLFLYRSLDTVGINRYNCAY